MSEEKTTYNFLVVDDHPRTLDGTADALEKQYPSARIVKARTAEEANLQVEQTLPDLAIVDLSLPQKADTTAEIDTGIQLLRTLMKKHPFLNLVVQSSYPQALVKIKPEIDAHKGGFTMVDKNLSTRDMLTRVDWSLQGLTYTKDLRISSKMMGLRHEWMTVLELAIDEALQDEEIARRMNVAKETVRHYWNKIQDVLDIYVDTEERKEKRINLRMLIAKRAREEGLID